MHEWHVRCPSVAHCDWARTPARTSHTRQKRVSGTREKESEMELLAIRIREFLRKQDGQDLIEYALLAALIALAAVVAMQATGTSINGVFNSISSQLSSAVSS